MMLSRFAHTDPALLRYSKAPPFPLVLPIRTVFAAGADDLILIGGDKR